MVTAATHTHDVVIVGGGHNALVAAAYLARDGRSVAVAEALPHVGGAAVSEQPWDGVDARLSRYSYLVSLLPRRIIDDLGLSLRLTRRRYSSYTPDPVDPRRGIVVDTADARASAESFLRVTGDHREAPRFEALYGRIAPIAAATFPTMTEPLMRASQMRGRWADDHLWHALAEQPLGGLVREAVVSDIARGIVLTDGLIGTFASADDPSLRQNRCFLYHVIGGGTGDWDVPVGGMGRVSGELERAARAAGAQILTSAPVTSISPDGEVHVAGDAPRVLNGRVVLCGVGPAVLSHLLRGGGAGADLPAIPPPEGAQLKVNMLLRRLPRLRDQSVSPEAAFSGTFHVNETLSQLEAAVRSAAAGAVPDPLPAEIYCHSLSDPSILGPALRASGAQTLTLFGLHTPHRLASGKDPDRYRAELLQAAERSLAAVLDEPLSDCLHTDAEGAPCIEARTTVDLEDSLGMTAGDIFHGPLSWPWADDDEELSTPAERWGVATPYERILLCGSSARRGGAVSGVGGHNAAMAVREMLDA
ncbi:NAD(P)/FAD-dependent oxidoreductase [Microbacterium sp. SSW1-59]|uniref:phytoene desaturase family protein n=1 Tax=Microbacterium xanthum TaxID=3079794 RepID=UPI002AD4DCD4|nr:NAD(P)/FAD-dependent oxidoreductase [Microbacterium sp. SSW1-59]MDZ8200116.1 NAD(P)/FAD-dependent oxidoreductase [Microbacterium sp. SSW1-59]